MNSLEKTNEAIIFVSDGLGSSSSVSEPRKKIIDRIIYKVWTGWTKRKTICDKNESNLLYQGVRGLVSYTYKQVKDATDNFDFKRLIHHDAFHDLFFGNFKIQETEALIKRLKHQEMLDVKDLFSVELRALAIVQHPNIVKAIGWCCELDHRLVIHESLPNGTLYSYVHSPDKCLRWDLRYKISIGLAAAILHLHDECTCCILHRNITSRNVLLSSDFDVKLGSFMLASFGDHGTELEKTALLNIPEQIKTECIRADIVTKAFDVHSFGIVLLEIATGMYSSDILKRICNVSESYKIKEAPDERLNGQFNKLEMERLIVAGLCCALPNSQPRPSMKEVFQYLDTGYPELITPKSVTKHPSRTASTSNMVLTYKKDCASSSSSQFPEVPSVDNPNCDHTGSHLIAREEKQVVSGYLRRSEFMIEHPLVDFEWVTGQSFDIEIPLDYNSTGPLKNSHHQMMKGFAATLHEKLESGVRFEEILKSIRNFTSALVSLNVPLEEWKVFAEYILKEIQMIEYLRTRYKEEIQQQTQKTLSILQMEIKGHDARIEDKPTLRKYVSELVDVQEELMELGDIINKIEDARRSLKDYINHLEERTTQNIEKLKYLKAEFVIWTNLRSKLASFSFGG